MAPNASLEEEFGSKMIQYTPAFKLKAELESTQVNFVEVSIQIGLTDPQRRNVQSSGDSSLLLVLLACSFTGTT